MFLRKLINVAAAGAACIVLIGAGLFAHGAFFAGAPLFVPAPERDPKKSVDLPIDKAVVHRLGVELTQTPGEAAVLIDPPAEQKELAAAFAVRAQAGEANVEQGRDVSLFSAGPTLDSMDQVTVRHLTCKAGELHLEIDYSNVRLDGAVFYRNIIWKPLVQAPIDLPAGKYQVRITWTKVPGRVGDVFKEVPPRVQSFAFTVVPTESEERNPVDLPIDKAVTHKLMQELKNTAGEAAVLANPPADLKVLAADFAATSLAKQAIVLNDQKLNLMSAGPILDSPDKVVVRKLTRKNDELQLDIDYTNVVLDGARLLQNYTWKPLVQAPVELTPGKYRLKVTWTKVRGELGDNYREVPPIHEAFAFVVVPAKAGVLPTDKSVLHRVSITSDDFKQFDEGVAVLKDAPNDVPGLARQYFGVRKTDGPIQFNLGSKLTLVAVGPQLNSPDLVRVQRLTRHENRLVLDIHYVQDVKNLRRNVPWRPIVTVPLDLLPGEYELLVNWQLYSDIDRALVPAAPLQHGSRFLIVTPGAKHKVEDVTDPARLRQADAVLRVRFVKAGPLEKTGYDEIEIIQVLKSAADANFQPTMKIFYSQTGEGGGVPRGECTIYLHRLAKDGGEAWLLGNGAKQGVSHCN